MSSLRNSARQASDTDALRPAIYEWIHPAPDESFRWHRHDFPSPIACWNYHPEYELHLITHGEGRMMVGDHIGPFDSRQLVLVGPELPHAWFTPVAPGDVLHGRDVVLQFTGGWINGLVESCPELNGLTRLLAASASGIEFTGPTAHRLGKRLEEMGSLQGVARLTACLTLMGDLAQCPYRRLSLETGATRLSRPTMRRMSAIIEEMLAADPTTLRHETASRALGLSPSAFSRQFRAATGGTFMEFVHKLRIGHACELLARTDQPITEICMASGFTNLSNFNRTFLRMKACTPRDYRRHSREIGLRCAEGADHAAPYLS